MRKTAFSRLQNYSQTTDLVQHIQTERISATSLLDTAVLVEIEQSPDPHIVFQTTATQ